MHLILLNKLSFLFFHFFLFFFNNISLNFLNDNHSYKGTSGLSLVIWVYKGNSNLKLYNLVDGEIGSASISTPEVGGSFNIVISSIAILNKVTYTISINGGSIVVDSDTLMRSGINLNDTTYFSVGSFLDDTTYPNSFSIRKINKKNFSLLTETITKIDNDVSSPHQSLTNIIEMPITRIILISGPIIIGITLVIIFGLRRRKEHE